MTSFFVIALEFPLYLFIRINSSLEDAIVVGPTNDEQLLLELINEARLDPMKNASRYIGSYSPLTSSDPDIQSALTFFGVSGAALQSAFAALTPMGALAWNDALAAAAEKHSQKMIVADTQSHQVAGELDLGARVTAEGYIWNTLGENVYAFADSVLYAHAGFMVDWGPGGMQSPPGHRNNIMSANFREIGLDVTQDSNPATSVGPLVVTEDLGARAGKYFIIGVAYTDLDNNDFYSVGEGHGDLMVQAGAASTGAWASGGFSLSVTPGNITVNLSGGGLSSAVNLTTTIGTENLKLDVVDGNTLLTSGSLSITSGPVATLRGIGARGLSLTTGTGSQTLEGTSANDTLSAGGGDDTIIGGNGSDTVIYSGTRANYQVTVLGQGYRLVDLRVSSPDGIDQTVSVEFFQFSDGVVSAANLISSTNSSPIAVTDAASLNEDASLIVSVLANDTDADNDTLVISSVGVPVHGTAVANPGGTITYTPTANYNGADAFTYSISDGKGGFSTASLSLTVNPVNDFPFLANAITDRSSAEDAAWTFQVPANAFSDVDNANLTYSATLGSGAVLPSWLTFTPATRTFAGTPPLNFTGALDLKITASDGSLSANDTFTLTVTPVNDAPILANLLADQSSAEDAAWSFQVPASAFSDVDNASLTYSATLGSGAALPAWLTFTAATRTFSGTPPLNFTGALDLKVTASDGSLSVSDTFTLTVTPVNDTPVVANPIADQSTAEDAAWSFQVPASAFSDVDNASLTYSATLGDGSALPGWLTFTPATRTFSGTPPLNFTGALDLKVTASDGSLSANDTFTLTVMPVNDAPILANSIADQSSAEDAAWTFQVPASAFSDVDNASLTYSATLGDGSALPAWLTFTPASRTFAGTPPLNFTGALDLKITASDGSLSASDTFTLTVTPVNDAPTVANAIADQNSPEDAAWSFQVPANAFSDVDNASLTYSATLGSGAALPAWLTFTAATRTFSGTPPLTFTGALDLKVTASDGSLSANDTFTLTVTSSNTPPSFGAPSLAISATAGQPLLVTVLATDPDGDSLTYTPGTSTKGAVSVSGEQVTYIAAPFASGSDSFVVTASDGHGGFASQTIDVTIAPGALPSPAFVLISQSGWAGTIGGNGSVRGTNGLDDISVLYGAITFDGSFNRGGDVVRFPGAATHYFVARSGSSGAVITDNADLRAVIPLGTTGLVTSFADGERTLVFSGGPKLGAQSFDASGAPIAAPADGNALPTGQDPAVQARLVLAGTALQPGEEAHVTIGGNVRVLGPNTADFVKLAPTGGQFVFDGSFNRGGDVIILNKAASAYTAVRPTGSSMLLQSDIEQLTIPLGTTGLILRFTDGDRTLVFKNGQALIGEQAIAGATPIHLSEFSHTISLDQGSVAQAATLSGADGTILFTDDALVTGNTVIQQFAATDQIRVTHAAASNYNFAAWAADPADLEITYSAGAITNTILIDNVLASNAFVSDYASATQTLGWNFMSFA